MTPPIDISAAVISVVEQVVDRRAAEMGRPEFVSQRTCEALLGIPKAMFLDFARRGRFPSTKERRLVVARFADVAEAIAGRMTRRPSIGAGADAESRVLALVGARRVAG